MSWVDVTVDVKDDQHPAMFNAKEMMLNLSGAVDLSTVSIITIGKVKYNILYTVDIAERGETTDVKLEEFKSKK
jgi:hypothetical protein